MIRTLVLKDVASYDSSGVVFSDLKPVNFIYGANGSGKTTISSMLANPGADCYAGCQVVWDQNAPLKTLVYNKKFKEDNFSNDAIEGIFTLGKANKDQIDQVERKKARQLELKTEGQEKSATHKKQLEKRNELDEEFRDFLWKECYKKYESVFKEAFRGCLQKDSFRSRFMSELSNNKSVLIDYNDLIEKANTIFGEKPAEIEKYYVISFEEILDIENSELWGKIIVGKADVEISALIYSLNMSDWINKGRGYIGNDGVCPFCQEKTISQSFEEQIERFFDRSFESSIKAIEGLKDRYLQLTSALTTKLIEIENISKVRNDSKLELSAYSAYLKAVLSIFSENYEIINGKLKEPSRSIELKGTSGLLNALHGRIRNANILIDRHNEIVLNYPVEKQRLISSIWRFVVEQQRAEVERKQKKIDGFDKGIENLNNSLSVLREQYKDLGIEIVDLTKDITSVQPTVDEINRMLHFYNFRNFVIVPSPLKPNYYQIKREDGSSAESTLSEGEITFITFLYFIQLAKGATEKSDISSERVLVIDDPISSLDSNVLFIVSTLLKKIMREVRGGIGNVRQLIVLTHNVYFQKEAAFIDGRTKELKDTNYWILRKKNNVSSVQCFGMKNPIQNTYEILWQELKSWKKCSGISVQNTMRRIIENYFRVLGKYGDDELIENFESSEERDICRSLISWINDGSHSINDDLYIELQDDTIENYLDVFKKIFIKTGHAGHYEMMMGVEN